MFVIPVVMQNQYNSGLGRYLDLCKCVQKYEGLGCNGTVVINQFGCEMMRI